MRNVSNPINERPCKPQTLCITHYSLPVPARAEGSLKLKAAAGMAHSYGAGLGKGWLIAPDWSLFSLGIKKPQTIADLGFYCSSLTVTYSDSCLPGTLPAGRLKPVQLCSRQSCHMGLRARYTVTEVHFG